MLCPVFTNLKIIDFAHHCDFCPPRLYFLILPFHMEHLFTVAIIFAITVIICYTNESFKTKLTTNPVFYFLHLRYVYSLSYSYLEIYRTAAVIRNPYYSLMVEFPCLVCDKPVAANHKAVSCDLFDKRIHI